MIKLKPLQWSGPNTPKVDIPYDNMIAYTPLGKFVLTWKSWKAESGNMGIGFDETPWGEAWYDFWDTPEPSPRAHPGDACSTRADPRVKVIPRGSGSRG